VASEGPLTIRVSCRQSGLFGPLFCLPHKGDMMGWDGMGWDGMGWDGMGWDGMGYAA
jgi:hypothetical protein